MLQESIVMPGLIMNFCCLNIISRLFYKKEAENGDMNSHESGSTGFSRKPAATKESLDEAMQRRAEKMTAYKKELSVYKGVVRHFAI